MFLLENNNLNDINKYLSGLSPEKRIEWGYNIFNNEFCITSSFGIQSAIMLHLISKVDKEIPVLFIDTGYHFPETIAYMEYFRKIFKLKIIIIKPEITRIEFEQKFNYPNENNKDFCCKFNKVKPLQNALKNFKCWGTGIRKEQTENREKTNFFIIENKALNRFKLSPILDFSLNDVKLYFHVNNLPEHPLLRKGYLSVGCNCCTTPCNDNSNLRRGRWDGVKTECGIHLLRGDGEGI